MKWKHHLLLFQGSLCFCLCSFNGKPCQFYFFSVWNLSKNLRFVACSFVFYWINFSPHKFGGSNFRVSPRKSWTSRKIEPQKHHFRWDFPKVDAPSAPDDQQMFHHFGCCLATPKRWHLVLLPGKYAFVGARKITSTKWIRRNESNHVLCHW